MEPKKNAANDPADPADETARTEPYFDEPGGAAPKTVEEADTKPDLAAEVAALNDRLLRALADNENQRRRAAREREDTAKFAVSAFARDMLTVADNLQRALAALKSMREAVPESLNAFVEGVELTERQLLATLERHGIRAVNPVGQKFDHNLHETLFEVPTADASPGTVVQVVEIGYTLHDRLLRAAKVGIAKAPPKNGGEEPRHIDTKV
jgi:molecular chaperone GrpE